MSTASHLLVLGTTNAGKLRELAELLDPLGIPCRSLAGLPGSVEVAETGSTFGENAALKATTQAVALGQWVLAEDSGLVVDALGGAPGIYSARFSDPGATDARNNALLLERLAAVPHLPRTAHYACHAALSDPAGTIVAVSSGTCGGLIATALQGAGGFGYDPLFIVPEYHRTFGELAPAVKSVISHRARALRALIPAIRRLLGSAGAGSAPSPRPAAVR
jgi:XTP/dITP diphosphohydrolase